MLVRRDGEPAKPWLTIVLDDSVAGYCLSFAAPSILHTALALRQAIWREEDPRWNVCGIPEVLYTDDGRDFTFCHLEQVGADPLSFGWSGFESLRSQTSLPAKNKAHLHHIVLLRR